MFQICYKDIELKTYVFKTNKFLFARRSDQERTVHKVYNTVPFSLQHGSYSVEVLEPLSADILDLDVVSNTFEPTVPSFADHLWGFFTGKK